MVLLRGLNYDYSGQQTTQIAVALYSGSGSSISLDNSEGFVINDYMVINPQEETAEIVKIATVPNATTVTTTATFDFAHAINENIYRLPYNQMIFYESASATGTYTTISSGSTVEMSFADIYTTTEYEESTSDYYYKRIFKNETTGSVSSITLSQYWQVTDEELYITPEEVRVILQFGPNDPPSPNDMRTIIKLAQDKVDLDLNTTTAVIRRIAAFLLSKSYILRSLATKTLSKGYITINAEGRSITKAYQELVLEAENTFQEYKIFIINNGNRNEVTKTDFMDDTSIIDGDTRRQIIDILTGTQNILDYDSAYRTLYGRKRRTYDT